MSTSLAEQLQRLVVPQTSVLTKDKKKPSLLFDPKEAAALSRNEVFQIGLEGLEELIERNVIFEQFKTTLFDATSKNFERSVQDLEANKLLDSFIQKFILLLSPYFLLKSSHKALEWMIHRYSIHEYNRDDLLMLILPYHESNIFVRTIQLMKFKDSKDTFYFLKALQKPGIHLTKNALLNQASANPGFLKFVSKLITKLIQVHPKPNLLTVAFNFYCTCFLGAIEFSKTVQEDQISQMLPSIIKGLDSNIADYCAATYVITANLLSKRVLADKLLNKIVKKVAGAPIDGLKTEACLLLVVVYQSQKEYKQLPEDAIVALQEKEWFLTVLNELNEDGAYVYPFLEVLVKSNMVQLQQEDSRTRKFLIKLFEQVKFDDSWIQMLLLTILEAANEVTIKKQERIKHFLISIFHTLERMYPNAFDKAVYKIMSDSPKELKDILNFLIKDTMAYKGKFEILEKLCHGNSKYRKAGLKFLIEKFSDLDKADQKMFISLALDRLEDESPEVFDEALNFLEQHLQELGKDQFSIINRVLGKISGTSKKLFRFCTVLIKTVDIQSWDIFVALFPHLLVKSKEQYQEKKKLIQQFSSKHKFFSNQNFQDYDGKMNILEVLDKKTSKREFEAFIECMDRCKSNELTATFKYWVCLILSHLVPKPCSQEIANKSFKMIQEFYKDSKFDEVYDGKSLSDGFFDAIDTIISKIEEKQININVYTEDSFIYNLIEEASKSKNLLKCVLNKFCPSVKEKLEFLLSSAVGKKSGKQLFLKSALDILQTKTEENPGSYTLALCLILLADDEESNRKRVLKCLKSLSEVSHESKEFIDKVLQYESDIVMDKEQIPLILFNIFTETDITGNINLVKQELLTHFVKSESLAVKSGLCSIFTHLNGRDVLEATSQLSLKLLETNSTVLNKLESNIIEKSLSKLDSETCSFIKENSTTWQLVVKALEKDQVFVETTSRIVLMSLVLDQIEKEVFLELGKDMQKQFVEILIKVCTFTKNPEVLPRANSWFKHVDLDSELIVDLLISMKEVQSPKLDPQKRKRRISVVPTIDILDTKEWKQGVAVLEFIQDKKKIRKVESIVGILFDLLKKCLDFDEQAVVEYPKQLILSTILHSLVKINDLQKGLINMELIVQCIRASQNPQTHHHALLVLAEALRIVPDQVLHHIMAIFTFMGSSVLRHDDAYSFQIITKIIDAVIPILVKDRNPKTVSGVLRVFVDALLDIPEHRRLRLFQQLLEKLDVEENLYLFLLLVFEAHVVHHSLEKVKQVKGIDSAPKRLSIASDLCRLFEPKVVILTCTKLVKYLKSLPEEKDDQGSGPDPDLGTFNINNYTPKQFRHYKYTLVTFISALLASKEFVNQVAQVKDEVELEGFYKDLIINILTFIQSTSKVAERNVNTPQAQYWKVLLHHSYDILDGVNALLTSEMFLLVMKGLMVHNLATVKRRALELLNSKIQNSSLLSECKQSDLLNLVPTVLSIIEGINSDSLDPEQETIIQTALLSLKLLIKNLAKEEPDKFVQILDFVTEVIKSNKAQNNLLASVVLCLAELCVHLRARAISGLPNYMPVLLKILKRERTQESPSLLLLSTVTAVQKIVDALPLFLSAYLEKLLFELCVLGGKWGGEEKDQKVLPLISKLEGIKVKLGQIPCRVLVPAVEQCYGSLIENKAFEGIKSLMEVLSESLKKLTEVNANLPDLTAFFLSALQFRAENDLPEADFVEECVVKALSILILKLSESSFRPLYYKLFDWAVRGIEKSERVITFYKLSNGIAHELKGLFVLFAGHFLNNAAQLLDSCNKIKQDQMYFDKTEKNLVLLDNILLTLKAVFTYDNQRFINKERFEVLMQPIVDQLENDLGGLESLKRRNEDILTPCIVQFALAIADDGLWKQMNYQILLKMRHDLSAVRLVALHCLAEVVKKLGEDFLPLLPETIPFLAELLEDEDEEVESACKRAVQEMEKVLGEPLQKYF